MTSGDQNQLQSSAARRSEAGARKVSFVIPVLVTNQHQLNTNLDIYIDIYIYVDNYVDIYSYVDSKESIAP